MTETDELLTTIELANILKKHRDTVYRMIKAGKVPAPIPGLDGTHRFVRSEILAWITAGCPDRQRWEVICQTQKTQKKLTRR